MYLLKTGCDPKWHHPLCADAPFVIGLPSYSPFVNLGPDLIRMDSGFIYVLVNRNLKYLMQLSKWTMPYNILEFCILV